MQHTIFTYVLIFSIFFSYDLVAKSKDTKKEAKEVGQKCTPSKATPRITRSQVYRNKPFKAKEEARYDVYYGAVRVHVGYGFIRVGNPERREISVIDQGGQVKRETRWHRIFETEGFTGDWYRFIFRAHDTAKAVSRPWDFGVSHFHMLQNEEKPFSSTLKKEKWLEFDHVDCVTKEKEINYTKNKEDYDENFLSPGSIDALGVVFKLRTLNYKIGKKVRLPVYTSEKNWWLEVLPEKFEEVKIKGKTYNTVKLKLKSYLGKDLQQKGRLSAWIETKHPSRPLVKVEGELKFGSVYMELTDFSPGRSL